MSALSVNAFILNKKKQVLIIKRSKIDTFFPGFWELPGGGVNEGETPQEAIIREVKEECGVGVEVREPLQVSNYTLEENGEKIHNTEITFLCLYSEKEKLMLSDEHTDYKWITEESFMKTTPLSDYIQHVIKTAFAHTKILLNS